jgi:hypothetical protein
MPASVPTATAAGAAATAATSATTVTTTAAATTTATLQAGQGILATSAAAVHPLLAKFLMVAPPLAAQVVFLAPMGAMRTFKKEGTTGAVSPINLAAMCVNGIVWISYGAMRSEPTIWAPNITAFLFGSYYLYTFNQYKAKGVSMTPSLAGVAVASLATGGVIAAFDPATAGDIIGHAGIGIVAVMFGYVSAPIQLFSCVCLFVCLFVIVHPLTAAPPPFSFLSFSHTQRALAEPQDCPEGQGDKVHPLCILHRFLCELRVLV